MSQIIAPNIKRRMCIFIEVSVPFLSAIIPLIGQIMVDNAFAVPMITPATPILYSAVMMIGNIR